MAIAEEDALDHVLEQRGRAEDAPERGLPRGGVHRLELRHRPAVLLRQPQHPPHLPEDAVPVERGEGGGGAAEDGDEERVGGARGVSGDADEQRHGGGGGREAERAEERAGGRVPAVGRHHEQPVAAHGRLQVERRRPAERELQVQVHAVLRGCGGRHGRVSRLGIFGRPPPAAFLKLVGGD